MAQLYFQGPPSSAKPSIPPATSPPITCQGRWEEAGGEPAAQPSSQACKGGGLPAPAHCPPGTAGVCCSRGGGVSRRMRGPDALQALPPTARGLGRGLPRACARPLQHCRARSEAALVWHLPENTRGRGDGKGRGLVLGLLLFIYFFYLFLQLLSPPSVRCMPCHRIPQKCNPMAHKHHPLFPAPHILPGSVQGLGNELCVCPLEANDPAPGLGKSPLREGNLGSWTSWG